MKRLKDDVVERVAAVEPLRVASPPAAAAPVVRGKRRWPWLILLALLLVGGLAAWRYYASPAPAAEYATAPVRRATIEDAVSALGNIQPRDYVDVGTQVSGQLRVINVKIGDRVRQGDLLAELDPTVYQTRVDADRAQLDNLRAQLDERRARLTLAQQQLTRQQNLRRQNATSEELLQQAQAELGATAAQIKALEAQTGQTTSQLKGDEANLGYTRIYAPMTGTVVSISARRGQTLNANQSAPIVLRVADLSVMTVTTQVSEADVGRLRIGQEVYFSTLGNPDKRYTSTLRQILPTPEVISNVVLYNALLDVPNPDGTLMTQMTAQTFFVIARAENVPAVPASALRASPKADGKASVLVVGEDGTPERREVEVGVTTRTLVEIRGGLKEGEEVVTGPAARPGETRRGSEPGGPPTFRPRLG